MKLKSSELNRKRLESKAKSYTEYLNSLKAQTPEEELADDTAKIKVKLATNDVSYGSDAEGLAKSGLSDSGYSEYLRNQLIKKSEASYNKAYRSSRVLNYQKLSGYKKYISGYHSAQEKIREGVLENLIKNRVFDKNIAYQIAIDAGLNEDYAFSAATDGAIRAKHAAINNAIEHCKNNSYYPAGAELYALSIGLDEKSAQRVRDAISEYTDANEYEVMTEDEFLEKLREEQENKKLNSQKKGTKQ